MGGNAVKKASLTDDREFNHLLALAARNLNYSSSIPEDKILKLCQKMETVLRNEEDYEYLFLVRQIAVNSYCLKGDVGLAVGRAQQMYEEAKRLKSEVGIALSIQAIGDTYMYSSRYTQAYEAFNEAKEILNKQDNNMLLIRLLTQQMHVCMLREDMEAMRQNLTDTRKLLDRVDFPNKSDYVFYLQCYQIYHDIALKDPHLVWINMANMKNLPATDQLFDRWYYMLSSRYCDLIGEYEKALLYCDSSLVVVKQGENLIEYKKQLLDKASLLHKSQRKREACDLYKTVHQLEDSLSGVSYTNQIDSLHVNYWVDKVEIEKAAMHNRFLTGLILCAVLILFVGSLLIVIARKKNRKLIESRRRLETAKKEAADSIQSKSLFLSNMSHELRTPLNAIVGFADLLAMEAVDDQETKLQFGERIRQNADLLLKLFNDVADLSALKGNHITFTYTHCDAVSLCRNVIDTIESVKQTSARLQFSTSLPSLPLYTDTGRLQQVLINLLINATKFTSEGTITLTLKLDKEHRQAVFAVEDTGCGIPLEKQPRIFERFEKLHEGIQGAGLGLSICQLIVEHNGGRIWIDSEYTQGARFVFTHPLEELTKETDL